MNYKMLVLVALITLLAALGFYSYNQSKEEAPFVQQLREGNGCPPGEAPPCRIPLPDLPKPPED